MHSPILFLVFNRPTPTQKVFNRIRSAQPKKLYISCDGAREGNATDQVNVDTVKNICSQIDWPCNVKRLYRDKNLGCGLAVSSAIDWFFSFEDEGIILEDDCLPSNSFFEFCDQMLEQHRFNENIFIVSGYNAMQRWKYKHHDYFYSYFGGIWGWATWRRAWKFYDFHMHGLEDLIASNFFIDNFGHELGSKRVKQLVKAKAMLESGELDTWDYQWGFSRNSRLGLSCVPSISLIRNIGFGDNATHTKSSCSNIIEEELQFPIRVNYNIRPDPEYDYHLLQGQPLLKRVFTKIKKFFK